MFSKLYFTFALQLVAAGECATPWTYGPGSLSGKALGYGQDGQGSIPGYGREEIFLHSIVFRLCLWSTQPPIK